MLSASASSLALCGLLAFGSLLELATANGLTAAQKTAILDLHNTLRAQKNDNQICTASDMQKLTWDDSLAASSQSYSELCVGDHHADAGGSFGENLWMNIHQLDYTTDDMKKGTMAWYDEWKDTIWSWGANSVVSKPMGQCTDISGSHCNIGHYFQVIWAKTAKVGCGVASCPNLKASNQEWGKAVYLVCRYDVPSKYSGGGTVGLPYMVGKPCAACAGSCENGLCTAAPTTCVDRSSNCAAVVGNNPSAQCTGQTLVYCAKTCKECTPASGTGYEQCPGYSPDLVTTTTAGAQACNLPALPLNSYWECKAPDCRSIEPVDIGMFMYSIAYDPDIQCKVRCKPFSRGALDTGDAIRFSTPSDRVGIAQKCTTPGLTLAYESQAPQSLVDTDNYILKFCKAVDECVLPPLKDTNAVYDSSSCNIGKVQSTPSFPASPAEMKERYLKDQACKVKCKEGYELDSRYAQKTGPCKFPGGVVDSRILGAVGPPTWQGGKYSLPPVCLKIKTSGWLSTESGNFCKNHQAQYTIDAAFKQDTGCPTECITGGMKANIIGWGTDGKQQIVNKCKLMESYDSSSVKYVQGYCCCAKAECFDSTGKLKTSISGGRLLGRREVPKIWGPPQEVEEVPQDPRMLSNNCPTTTGITSFGSAIKGLGATTTTATTTAGQAGVPKVVTAETKLTLASVPTNFTTDPKVKESLQQAIADTITGVNKDQVTILGITTSRRLHDVESDSRRLATGVTVRYEINLPASYTGAAITASSIDAAALKTNINSNFQSNGVDAQVSAVEIKSVQTVSSSTIAKIGSASSTFRSAEPAALVALMCLMVLVNLGMPCTHGAP